MKKILLTGVTGFLGSHLAKALVKAGFEVIALKRKLSSLRRVESIAEEILFIDIESLNYESLFRDFGQIDVIIHTATCYGRNNQSVSEIHSANTEFPLRLLDGGSRHGVKLFLNTDTILDKYLNLYAMSKNQLLQWGRFFAKEGNIRFGNIRLEHFYGPDDDPTKFTAYVISGCLNNIPELKLTKGEQRRDFIHVDDVVSAYMILLEKMGYSNCPFFEFDVGSGQSISIRNFVEIAHRLTESETRLAFGAIPYREGEVMHSEANITPLTSLGWKCKNNVEMGLRKVIEEEMIKV